jgi:mercuric ion binding protein
MKRLVLAILVIGFGVFGCQKKHALEVATIHVNSMVCNSCVKTVNKAIYAVEGVKDVDIDLKSKVAEVKYVPEQTNLQTIELAITEAGYNANDRKRNPDAYEKLDKCCKIDN